MGAAAYGSLAGPLSTAQRAFLFFGIVMLLAYFKYKHVWIGAASIMVFVLTLAYRRLAARRLVSIV